MRVRRGAVQWPQLWSAIAVLCASTGILAFGAGSALAAPPEAPELSVEAITTTEATLHGVLNPLKEGEPGTYEFLYDPERNCKSNFSLKTLQGLTLGFKHEELPAEVLTVLQPNREYGVCLRVQSTSTKEATLSPQVTFKTLAAPPTVGGEGASVGSTAATLEAQVNPNNQETIFSFQYATNEALTGATTVAGAESLGEYGARRASVSTGVLEPDTTYFYRVIAENEQSKTEGKPVEGKVEHFTTVPAPNTDAVKPIAQTTATFNGHLMLGPLDTRYFFRYNTGTECTGGSSTPEAHAGAGAGELSEATEATELMPGTEYTVCFVTANGFGSQQGSPITFTTLAGPFLQNLTAKNITASTAELDATLNPQGLAVSSCTFEYGTSLSYGRLAPCSQTSAQIGAGNAPVAVNVTISPLEPNTTYHWRLAAHDVDGTVFSPDHTFVYPTTGETLPDNRAYEMVTPPQKNGALLGDIFLGQPPDISETGSRVIALSIQCFAASESCSANRGGGPNGEPFAFTRTAMGWETTALAPPAHMFSENTAWRFSADAGTALFSIPTGPAQEDEWYARQPGGSFLPIGPATPPGTSGINPFGLSVKASTADLSHFVWVNNLAEGPAWPFDKTTESESLYEYVGTANPRPFLVGVSGGLGSTELISTCGTTLGARTISVWNALSADGRTAYFTAYPRGNEAPCPSGSGVTNEHTPVPARELYARVDGELPDAHTIAISHPECGSGAAPAEQECREASPSDAAFQSASIHGSRAFFLDTQKLIDGATEGTGSAALGSGSCVESANDCNLYLYDFSRPAGENLIDVSAGDTSGLGPGVQGVVATAADGSHVYFVALGTLTATPNEQGQRAQDGANNLYLYERDARYPEGHTTFIAPLPASDFENWNKSFRKANVTPDGRFLVFESNGALTPDATRTDGAVQIYRYDAQTTELARISIGNDGFHDNGNEGVGGATIVPAVVGGEERAGPARGDPTMSNDGSYVFFQSPVSLTPRALDDVVVGHFGNRTEYAENVYEYHEGHVYLISDGRDASNTSTPCGNGGSARFFTATETFGSGVCLVGTDATGSNVFFTTADQLVPADTDTQVDIYDARICQPASGNPCIQPVLAQLPPCGGEACHGIPGATPSLLAPGTASFNGEGNIIPPPPSKVLTNAQKLAKALKACRTKHNRRKRSVCERQAKRKYSSKAKKAKRATTNWRAGR